MSGREDFNPSREIAAFPADGLMNVPESENSDPEEKCMW